MDWSDPASVAFTTGRIVSRLVLVLLLGAAVYAGVMAAVNWTSIGV